MGGAITNFLSRSFISESYRLDGDARRVEFVDGILKKDVKIKCPPNKHGLLVLFTPSDIMGEITVDPQQIEYMLWQQAHMYPIGTKIIYSFIDPVGGKHKVVLENKQGMYGMLSTICEKPLITPIYYSTDNGTRAFECLFTYDIKNMSEPQIMSFANMCYTVATGSTQVKGFLDALCKYFRDYMNKIYLANNKKLQVITQDIKTGLRAIVACKELENPLFTGQSKEIYSSTIMEGFSYTISYDAIDSWAKKNPQDLQKLAKYFKDVCEMRYKLDGEKIKLHDKFEKSIINRGLPPKYIKPNEKGPFELFIVEGDSAMGGIRNNRWSAHQGVYPIKGKITNCFMCPPKKFFENPDVAGLFKIMGYDSYSKNFNPDHFLPSKIIITTDADADGYHIESLLLMMYLRYLPFVIEQGKLYAATPPLYSIPLGKGKMKFFANNIEYIEYVQNLFCKINTIANEDGKVLSKNEILRLLYKNIDYVKIITHLSNIFAIDPYFLEFLLYHKDLSYNKLKSEVEKTFKYVTVSKQGTTILMRGLVGSLFQTVFFDDRLLNECKPLIELIENDKYYYLNNNKCTIYYIMKLFGETEPTGITRYKGLGELKPEHLAQTTILPGGRTLHQYTTDNILRELKFIANIQSDKSEFIKGIKVRREDII